MSWEGSKMSKEKNDKDEEREGGLEVLRRKR